MKSSKRVTPRALSRWIVEQKQVRESFPPLFFDVPSD